MNIWTLEKLQKEALKYETRTEFHNNSKYAYELAHKLKIFDLIGQHMPKLDQSGSKASRFKWTLEKLQKEALKYENRIEFKTNSIGAYSAAIKNGALNNVCKHMKRLCHLWTNEEIAKEAAKYTYRLEFQKKCKNAYSAALLRNILDEVCKHMPIRKKRIFKPLIWTLENTQKEALKYETRSAFERGNGSAYTAARKGGLFDIICSHMNKSSCVSFQETELYTEIKKYYPNARKLRDRKVNILNKPHFKGFDIDIYVPELNKGVEFDGKYWHSPRVMAKSNKRKYWPYLDIKNYHQIKDNYFKSKGIKILHIKEVDWIKDKKKCIKKCLKFLT